VAGDRVDFARDIRPILARNCCECHGPEKRKSGLRLDRKADALAGGDSGPVIAPGRSDESELISRVTDDDPTTAMPPKGRRLSRRQVELLRAWIDQGAPWPDGVDATPVAIDHWAFRPPSRPTPPAVRRGDWVRTPIDTFVLAKLERLGVSPSPEADRPAQIRRLSLDLLGLPPTLAELAAFVADPAPDAYDRLVDRLLASPHCGERWGRHWLDLARYADSDGYEKDSPRPHAWRYRQWVIDAINRDLPFDQFTIEQLAGDLLPVAAPEQKAATGFHRNTLTNKEGGVDPEEFRVAAVVDRVNTTGTVWLGLTVGCAQCHNHKYDPITQEEYYGLFAFFNTGREVDLPAPPRLEEVRAYEQAKSAYDGAHARLEAALARYDEYERPARQAEWERAHAAAVAGSRWLVLDPIAMTSAAGTTLSRLPDRSVLASGTSPATDTYTIVAETDLESITAVRVEVLDHPSLPAKGPGRAANGNFVLSEIALMAAPSAAPGRAIAVGLQAPSADFSQAQWDIAGAIDGNLKTGWAIAQQFGTSHRAVFETTDDIPGGRRTRLEIALQQQHGDRHTIGRLRLAVINRKRPPKADGLPDDVAEILFLAPAGRTDAQRERLAAYHRTIDPEWSRRHAAVAAHAKRAPAPPDARAMTLAENPNPPTTHVLIRGDFLRPGAVVRPHTPAILPTLAAARGTPTRLDLARWLVDPANPLTPRVAVNRIWRHLFGRPLVATVEDFGTRGEPPTHPELLDWLAAEFPARGWSPKLLIRSIVTSATYRQASRTRPELVDRDPNNAWLARQNRFRPEAEVLRDLALAVSGLLQPILGGPSARPPQPPGISEITYAGSARWVESTGPNRYRRGLYTWFQRTSPYPMLVTFDAPDANVCAARRERSDTPLQALTLLNDAVFVECAQAFGRRIVTESPRQDPKTRIAYAFRLGLARDPTAAEAAELGRLYETLVRECRSDPEAAAKLAGPLKPPGIDSPEAGAWVALARTILNLDEFVTRE
jgi:hypothetical protein